MRLTFTFNRRAIGLFYEASAAAGDMMLTKLKPPLGPCWRRPDTTTWLAKLLTLHCLWSVRQTDWRTTGFLPRSSDPLSRAHAFHGEVD